MQPQHSTPHGNTHAVRIQQFTTCVMCFVMFCVVTLRCNLVVYCVVRLCCHGTEYKTQHTQKSLKCKHQPSTMYFSIQQIRSSFNNKVNNIVFISTPHARSHPAHNIVFHIFITTQSQNTQYTTSCTATSQHKTSRGYNTVHSHTIMCKTQITRFAVTIYTQYFES
jgi:hypothetical protein